MRYGTRGLLFSIALLLSACQGAPTVWLDHTTDGDQLLADGDTTLADGDETPVVCQADTARCVDLSLIELCDEGGQGWRPYRECPEGKVCVQNGDWASCEACLAPPTGYLCCPKAAQCIGDNELQVCDDKGQNWLFNRDCGEQGMVCREGACIEPEDGDPVEEETLCTPGRQLCMEHENSVGTCSADGQSIEGLYACVDGYSCTNGRCQEKQCVNPFPGTCGLLMIVCCPGSTCVETPDYPGGICNPDPLPPFCKKGERSCADERTPAVCEEGGRTKTQLAPCKSDESCINGVCVPPGCPLECPAGTSCLTRDNGQCFCHNPLVCDSWGLMAEPCCPGYTCSGKNYGELGFCENDTTSCTPGERSCHTSETPQICEADGKTRTALAKCTGQDVCKEGRCVYKDCPAKCPNGQACVLGMDGCGLINCRQPLVCGLLMPACCPGYHCSTLIYGVGGYCVDDSSYPACTPGKRFCLDGIPAICESDGKTPALLERCISGASCVNGACQEPPCTPGSQACANSYTPTICDADGQTRIKLPKCLPELVCNEGNCVYPGCPASCPDGQYCYESYNGCMPISDCGNPPICEPGSQMCCKGYSCEAGHINDAGYLEGFCIYEDPPEACTPGTRVCGGFGSLQTVDVCQADGHSRRTETLCAQDEVCLNGHCQAPPCTPGELFCATSITPAICAEDGQTRVVLASCRLWDTCNEGHCVAPGCPPTCPQGKVCIDGTCQYSPYVCANPEICGYGLSPCCTGYKCSPLIYGVQGFCVKDEPACTPGERLCITENSPGFCEADGQTRIPLPNCPDGTICQNGLCGKGGENLQDCAEPCSEGYVCDRQYGQCVLNCPPCATGYHCDATSGSQCVQDTPAYCSPGALSCLDEKTPNICFEDAKTLLTLEGCPDGTSCKEGHCVAPGCPATCDEGLTCNAETQGICEYLPGDCNPSYCYGFYSQTQRCCVGYFCSSQSVNTPGHCIKEYDSPCIPGARICADNKHQAICQTDGHSRSTLPACAFGQICSEGICVPKGSGGGAGGACINPAICGPKSGMSCCQGYKCLSGGTEFDGSCYPD